MRYLLSAVCKDGFACAIFTRNCHGRCFCLRRLYFWKHICGFRRLFVPFGSVFGRLESLCGRRFSSIIQDADYVQRTVRASWQAYGNAEVFKSVYKSGRSSIPDWICPAYSCPYSGQTKAFVLLASVFKRTPCRTFFNKNRLAGYAVFIQGERTKILSCFPFQFAVDNRDLRKKAVVF